MRVGHEPLARRLIGSTTRAIRMVPIHQRIIEANAKSLRTSCVHELAYQVTFAGGFRRAIAGKLTVEETESFVVLGRHHHVLLARFTRESRPLSSCVGRRQK